MIYPRLYKRNSRGKLQFWEIRADDGLITTTFGRIGGLLRTTEERIGQGENLGKAAEKEAKARWIKKQKAGYTTDWAAVKKIYNQ